MNGVRSASLLAIIASALLIIGACADGEGETIDSGQAADETDSGAEQSMPTPNRQGLYQGLTVEQAGELMPFEILRPGDIPDFFELASVSVESEPLPNGGWGDPITVQFVFRPTAGTSEDTVIVSQRTGTVILASEGERSRIVIADTEVTRNIASYDDGRVVASYNWRTDEYSISVQGLLSEGVDAGDLESLIELFLQP